MAYNIDVGPEAIDRANNISGDYTFLMLDNPANGTGLISAIEAWMQASGAIKVGYFYNTGGNNYKCRSAATLAEVTSGAKRTITEDSGSNPLSLAVGANDLIGLHIEGGAIEEDSAGFAGYMYVAGDHVVVNDETEYTLNADNTMSIKGLGNTPAAGGSGKGAAVAKMISAGMA